MLTVIEQALEFISPDCSQEDWLKIGAALYDYAASGGQGFTMFNEWSMSSSQYDFRATKNAWQGFRKAKSNITVATLYYAAFKAGWKGEKYEDQH